MRVIVEKKKKAEPKEGKYFTKKKLSKIFMIMKSKIYKKNL